MPRHDLTMKGQACALSALIASFCSASAHATVLDMHDAGFSWKKFVSHESRGYQITATAGDWEGISFTDENYNRRPISALLTRFTDGNHSEVTVTHGGEGFRFSAALFYSFGELPHLVTGFVGNAIAYQYSDVFPYTSGYYLPYTALYPDRVIDKLTIRFYPRADYSLNWAAMTDITVLPIPEPSAISMALGGLFVVARRLLLNKAG